jgi:energy-coupling factor transporter ATP-binding protein EcfA2
MITLQNISFAYPDQSRGCLRDLSLTIRDGESVCVMGPNGCGKSTLARLIAGLIQPTDGTISIDHEETGTHALPIGLLFQDPDNQMVAALVDKEIAFALENLAVPPAEMRGIVSTELDRFGLTALARSLTTELSGGEKQRVALASLMVAHPHLLILDEPDSYLDESGRAILNSELARLHREDNKLVEIRITQYPHVARQYPRLVVIHDGQVAADADPIDIFSDAASCARWGLSLSEPATIDIPLPSLRAIDCNPARQTVSLSRLSFGYGDRYILQDISLTWEQGETICVVGPSGSGKSTLGHLLCGLLEPRTGTLTINAEKPRKLSDSPGTVAGLFQQPERQFFLPTVRQEIAFGPANRGQQLSDSDCARLLTSVGLDSVEFLERDPFSLSMGEKRRLAFAIVLALSPSFIVFDEPTCALDPAGVGSFIGLSRFLKQKQIGQCIISHDPDLVAALSDRVLLLAGDRTATELSPTAWFSDDRYRALMPLPGSFPVPQKRI